MKGRACKSLYECTQSGAEMECLRFDCCALRKQVSLIGRAGREETGQVCTCVSSKTKHSFLKDITQVSWSQELTAERKGVLEAAQRDWVKTQVSRKPLAWGFLWDSGVELIPKTKKASCAFPRCLGDRDMTCAWWTGGHSESLG